MILPPLKNCSVAVIGLGYVGLPLALELGKKRINKKDGKLLERKIIGFDIKEERIDFILKGIDTTKETSKEEIAKAKNIEYTCDPKKLSNADVFIISVPTPITEDKEPDLNPLILASKTVGKALLERVKDCLPIIVYESTVYPGTTEDICVPILEKESKLKFNKEFFCGYSPERINPGDPNNRLPNIKKVTSGSTKESAIWVDEFYSSIIDAGTHLASSIKVAEAAKIIENTQRDLNIALINELAKIFNLLDIDTLDVLEAARTKWNFLDFRPGLVGGHCIGVDPYYLTYKAKKLGFYPSVVLAGRETNDGISSWISKRIITYLEEKNLNLNTINILIMGFTFKNNCPDTRNTKVLQIYNILCSEGINVEIFDPLVDVVEVKNIYNINILEKLPLKKKYQVVIAAVNHDYFVNLSRMEWQRLISKDGFFFDIKGIIPRDLNVIRI